MTEDSGTVRTAVLAIAITVIVTVGLGIALFRGPNGDRKIVDANSEPAVATPKTTTDR